MKNYILLLLFAIAANAQVTGLSNWSLFIDPGHSKTANMGVNGYSEAESNLKIALHLKNLLSTKTDIGSVWTSRTNDTELVGLYDRSVMANNLDAAWFHSIHSNAPSSTSSTVLLLYGESSPGVEKTPNGGKAMSYIMTDVMSATMRIPEAGGQGARGDCVFYGITSGPYLSVNRNTVMPSELSESGHHTVPWQNNLQMNYEYARLVAHSIYWSVLDLHGIARPYPGILTGIIRDSESMVAINGATIQVGTESYTTDTFESLFNKYTSDPDKLNNGFYYFEDLPDQAHEIVVSAPGYYSDTLQITDMVDNFATFLDIKLNSNTPPYVITSYPANGDSVYPAWDVPYFDFSRSMDKLSVETAFSVTPHFEGTFYFTPDQRRMAYLPTDTLEYLTNYTITIAGTAVDSYGHPLDGDANGVGGDDWTITFKTSPADITAPSIVKTFPAIGATMVDLRPIFNIVWDEELNPASISPDLVRFERILDSSIPASHLEHRVVNDQSIFILYATETFLSSEAYRVRVLPGIKDLFGNALSSGRVFTFETANYEYSTTSIDNFENSLATNWWQPGTSGSTTGSLPGETAMTVATDVTVTNQNSNTSMRLDYGWDTNASSWLIREYLSTGAPRNATFNSSRTMQAYVFGDGNGHKFRFCVDDKYPVEAAANHEVSPWYTVDWFGWRLVSWDMNIDGTGSWLGDGALDGTLRFDSIQLTYTQGKPITGTYYIDELRLANLNYLAVEGESLATPTKFSLLPNYPNPFNPMTNIPFTVPQRADVSINIYNLKGELVESVFRGQVEAGKHVTRWNASGAASGMYLVTMETYGNVITRKITVLK